jgi:hypothetical protein
MALNEIRECLSDLKLEGCRSLSVFTYLELLKIILKCKVRIADVPAHI